MTGTPFDLREAVPVGYRVELDDEQLARGKGFDHCYVLADVPGGARPPALAAVVTEPVSGRTLEVRTDQPGVQFFTGGSLAGTLVGKAGSAYGPRSGFALETQGFPDAPNRPGSRRPSCCRGRSSVPSRSSGSPSPRLVGTRVVHRGPGCGAMRTDLTGGTVLPIAAPARTSRAHRRRLGRAGQGRQ